MWTRKIFLKFAYLYTVQVNYLLKNFNREKQVEKN